MMKLVHQQDSINYAGLAGEVAYEAGYQHPITSIPAVSCPA